MKLVWTSAFFLLANLFAQAQVLTSQDVNLSFFSDAPIEDITAESHTGVSALNVESKSIYFKVAIRSFQFRKSLMQEHFNENYMESHKYPHAEFKGQLTSEVDFSAAGTYPVNVEGELTIHNVTKSYHVDGELRVTKQAIEAQATFLVKLVDHQIKIPRLLIKNIAEMVEVSVAAKYESDDLKIVK
jgi:polyisoprenoid-binding protein YceI